MSESPAESSSQALERFLSAQLAGLSLTVPSDDVEYMARFVEEEGLEREEKVEGVKGMLEGVVEGGELPDSGVDEALGKVVDEWDRMRQEEEERIAQQAAAAREKSASPKPNVKNILSTLTPEELAAAQRQALIRQYGYIEGGPEDEWRDRADGPPRGETARSAEEKKAAEERRAMIEAALKLDGKKKKYKKQQEVDLMAPNLNRDKVAYKAQLEREAARKAAQDVRNRDKAALEKQRADQAKAKAEKQKKAQKQERRG
ncbi:hypothetical protein DB88DRAFT_484831 [Papiliotrema laurentii]|uniref:Coiled-coil domain-containing protein 43 n=1 Tax=Papiliotrema laurentii TaxID=5418 RepID=A0AAD9L7W3_PAPLA|nr:hypothetical protein DB88DRAFT_484831 [Papiliotrema laurentii]